MQVAEERGLDGDKLNQVRAQSLAEKNAQVILMAGGPRGFSLGKSARNSAICLHPQRR